MIKLNLKKLLYFQIILVIVCSTLGNFLGFSQMIYITDFISLVILLMLLVRRNIPSDSKKIILLFVCEILYWIISFCFSSYSNMSNFITMMRLYFRFFIMMIGVSIEFKENDYLKLFKWFDRLMILHTFLVFFQIFILKYTNGDEVGGIFGTTFGYANVTSHFFIFLVSLIAILNYLENKEKWLYSFLKIGMALMVAILTEMKSFIFEIAFVIILLLVLQKKIKIKYVVFIVLAIMIGFIFNLQMEAKFNFSVFSLDEIDTYLSSGYAGEAEGIGRFDGFEKINEYIFKNDAKYILFGKGFSSSISDYVLNYYDSMNLGYFTYAKIYFEVGMIGMILYYLIYVMTIIKSNKLRKKNTYLGNFSLVFSIMSIYFTFYGNFTTSTLCGYLSFILLAIPFNYREDDEK